MADNLNIVTNPKMKKFARRFKAALGDASQIQDLLREYFEMFDQDKSGNLTPDEILKIFWCIYEQCEQIQSGDNTPMNQEERYKYEKIIIPEFEALMEALDTDKNEALDIEEFTQGGFFLAGKMSGLLNTKEKLTVDWNLPVNGFIKNKYDFTLWKNNKNELQTAVDVALGPFNWQPEPEWYGKTKVRTFTDLTEEDQDYPVYQGEIKASSNNGRCNIDEGERIYLGYWRNGAKAGRGRLIEEDGTCYEGEFQKGVKEGKGKFWWGTTGLRYEGNFKNNEPHGNHGCLFFPDGSRWVGPFDNGVMNGKGFLFVDADTDGDEYTMNQMDIWAAFQRNNGE